MGTLARFGAILAFASLPILIAAVPANALPAFARKYKVGCNTCHTIYPQLNRFGRDFRDNGFRMPEEVQELLKTSPATPPQPAPAGPAASSEFWSFIPSEVPFAVQAKLHYVLDPKGDIKNDFQLDELQLQAAGTLTSRVSYYLHHHLAEEGEPGDVYTAWVRFNNLFGSAWVNVTAGQIELPLSFSPEIERLSVFDYLAFGWMLGGNSFALETPQLGAQLFGQTEGGTKVWFGVANGSGLAEDESTEHFDNNSFKDVYGRVTREFGEHFVGGFAYAGRARGSLDSETSFEDNFVRAGADAFLNFQRLVVFGSAIYGNDDDPIGTGESRSFWGGFVEGDAYINDRLVVLFRFDGVHQKQPAVLEGVSEEPTEPDEEPEEAFRVNTLAVTPGLQFLVRPNVKLGFEYQIRQTRAEDRGIGFLHVSF